MGEFIDVFVGIDVSKARNVVTIGDDGRGSAVRHFGEVDAPEESMLRVVRRIASRHARAELCYESGPTGYGPYRLITTLGYLFTVVTPLIPKRRRANE